VTSSSAPLGHAAGADRGNVGLFFLVLLITLTLSDFLTRDRLLIYGPSAATEASVNADLHSR
jgi:hypothetical protein